MVDLNEMGQKAKATERVLGIAGEQQKNKALSLIAQGIYEQVDTVLKANEKDIETARQMGIAETMIDRLRLDEERVKAIARAVLDIMRLPDPIGEIEWGRTMENGMTIRKVTVPLGVIGMIYESRPNVTVDAASLCLKAGNTVILRGGKEAIHSNTAFANIMRQAIQKAELPADCVQLITDTTRESSTALMQLTDYLDVLIPRGGAGLIKAVVANSKVPVIETGTGNCHVYVDQFADLQMAARIVDNAKTSRPSVCNACESLLVHESVANTFLPMVKQLLDRSNVEIRGCEQTKAILGDCVVAATDADYATEFLDYVISVKVVDSIEEAIDHITQYSSGHSECIVTENLPNAEKFLNEVDAAAVYVNASTRFTDGGVFGFGAEIGISTQKVHARGPMGLKQLTSVKYIIVGNGQVR